METYCEECGNPSDSCDCSAYWLEQDRIWNMNHPDPDMPDPAEKSD